MTTELTTGTENRQMTTRYKPLNQRQVARILDVSFQHVYWLTKKGRITPQVTKPRSMFFVEYIAQIAPVPVSLLVRLNSTKGRTWLRQHPDL